MKNKIALSLIYTASVLLLIGGLGDQFINELLEVHHRFLDNPPPSPLLERAQSLLILMLHVVGGGLMASGLACICMTHFALRQGQGWAKGAIFGTAFLSEGWNAYGMYSAGSYWMYPVTVLTIMVTGLAIYDLESKSHR